MLMYVGEPSCYDEAVSFHDHAKWKQALQNELEGINKNGKHYHVNGCIITNTHPIVLLDS